MDTEPSRQVADRNDNGAEAVAKNTVTLAPALHEPLLAGSDSTVTSNKKIGVMTGREKAYVTLIISPHAVADYVGEVLNRVERADPATGDTIDPILKLFQAGIARPVHQDHSD